MIETPQYGLRKATERPLTAKEKAAIARLVRRYRWGLLWALLCTPLALGAFVWTMTALVPYDSDAPMGLFLAALSGSMTALGLCVLGVSECFRRQRALNRDARTGVLHRYEGRLLWSDYLTAVQRKLLRRGHLRRDGTVVQALEVLPASGLVWSVDGIPLAWRYFDTEMANTSRVGPEQSQDTEEARNAGEGQRSRGGLYWLGRLWTWLWFLVWGSFFVSLAVRTLALPGSMPLRIALGALIVFAAFLVNVAVHEAGHLLAGWLMRMRFVWCRIGPILVWRSVGGLRCSWTGLRHYDSGVAQMVVEDERRYRWREGWMIAGGPLASLLLAVAMIVLWVASDSGRVWPAGESLFGLMAFLGASTLLGTFIPETDSQTGLTNDAGLLWQLWREPDGARHNAAHSVLWARMMRRERPKDWDDSLIERAAVDPWGGRDTWGCLMRFYHALDAGRLDEAEAELERGLREGAETMFLVEAAFFHALFRRDVERARAHLDTIPDEEWDENDSDHLRAEAAVMMIEGDEEARETAEAALQALQWEMTAGLVAAREDWLRQILTLRKS